MNVLNDLLQEIREQCSTAHWSQGVELSRRDSVHGLSEDQELIVLGVLDRQLGRSFRIELYPEDLDWTKDCPCKVEACSHVAAAIIVLKQTKARGEALPRSKAGMKHIAYRFKRNQTLLSFERSIVDESTGAEEALKGKLDPKLRMAEGLSEVNARELDLEIDLALGLERTGCLNSEKMAYIISKLDHESDIKIDGQVCKVGSSLKGLILEIEDEASGISLSLKKNPLVEESFSNGVCLSNNQLHVLKSNHISAELSSYLRENKFIASSDLGEFTSRWLPVFKQSLEVDIRSKNLPESTGREPLELELFMEKAGDGLLRIEPRIVYGDPPQAIVNHEGFRLVAKKAPTRDPTREDQLIATAEKHGYDFNRSRLFRSSQAIEEVQRLEKLADIRLSGPALRHFYAASPVQVDISFNEEKSDFQLSFSSKDKKITTEAIFEAWQKQERYVALIDEQGWARLPTDWLDRYAEQIQLLLEAKKTENKIPTVLLPNFCTLVEDMGFSPPRSVTDIRDKLVGTSELPDLKLPEIFEAKLRSYQEDGVRWLSFLKQLQLGALLADDMGLGKTLQSIAVLSGRCLVIAPTSVLFNWQKEIKRFRPNLKVHLYHGNTRNWPEDEVDVVLTSYGLLRTESEKFQGESWDMIVLDEAHWIKNPQAKVSQAAFGLRATFRCALSGTPIENSLDELWSIFRFLNPGLLGSLNNFKSRFQAKNLVGDDERLRTSLQELVRPFLLRRLKKQVAKDLPPRIEKPLYAELTPQERASYNSLLISSKKDLLEQMDEKLDYMAALEALLRLRQACCHLSLLPSGEASSSSKLEILIDSLETCISEGHKALIFSQWTSFLDLISQALNKSKIQHLRLDGQTQNREKVVEDFQKPNGPSVLIMSLKAGGVGLNLSQADHVFIMDPWWNPAAQDQAADRAHRIGQTNTVMVHQIIAKDTVEEKIVELQEHKRKLSEAALSGEVNIHLSKQDLLSLFE